MIKIDINSKELIDKPKDVEKLDGRYWDTLLTAMAYIESKGVPEKLRIEIVNNLSEILTDAQESDMKIEDALGGDVFIFIDVLLDSKSTSKGSDKFLGFIFTLSSAFLITMLLYSVVNILNIQPYTSLSNKFIIDTKNLFNIVSVSGLIYLTSGLYFSQDSPIKKVIFLVFWVCILVFMMTGVYFIFNKLGFVFKLKEFSVLKSIILILLSLSISGIIYSIKNK